MPTDGLSLMGFMGEGEALQHLKQVCIPPAGATDDSLKSDWAKAKAKLGAPVANAGHPECLPLPAAHQPHAEAMLRLPWVVQAFEGRVTLTDVQLVEIDPLLAYQFTVDMERSNTHCGAVDAAPSMDQLLATCLPMTQPTENINIQVLGQSAMVKSRSLNLRVQAAGIMNNAYAGVFFGPALPLVQVVRLNGRCYLHNGFHRAVGLSKRGVKHMPCVLRDVADAKAAGIHGAGLTFSEELLTSADPPTVGHFAQGRAFDVKIRAFSRVLHVSWADYVWPEE